METLILPRAYICGRMSPRAYFEAVQRAFLAFAAGGVSAPPVGHVQAEGGAFHAKAASRRGAAPTVVLKLNGNFPENRFRYGLPTIQGFIALLDARRGSVLALMDSAEITARRTAAASALSPLFLARPDWRVRGIVGCVEQARCHIDALRELFPLRRVECHDIDRTRAEMLASNAQTCGLDASIGDSVHAVAARADILVTS